MSGFMPLCCGIYTEASNWRCRIACTEVWMVFYAIAVSDTGKSLFILWGGLEVFKDVLYSFSCSVLQPFFTYPSGFRFLKKNLKIWYLTRSFAILCFSLPTPNSRPGCLSLWPLNSKERCVCPIFYLEVAASSREESLQPSAMVPQPGKNSSAAELPFKGNFQAKGTVGLLRGSLWIVE